MLLINLMLFIKLQYGFDEDLITKNHNEINF
jgi:hypothetical protein